jgi:hypothetical protein
MDPYHILFLSSTYLQTVTDNPGPVGKTPWQDFGARMEYLS